MSLSRSAACTLAYSDRGKPRLAPTHDPCDIAFNMSDSGNVALFAFARGADVGVDVEAVRQIEDMSSLTNKGTEYLSFICERLNVPGLCSATSNLRASAQPLTVGPGTEAEALLELPREVKRIAKARFACDFGNGQVSVGQQVGGAGPADNASATFRCAY